VLTLRALFLFMVLNLSFRLLGFNRVFRLLLRRSAPGTDRTPLESRRRGQRVFQAVQTATMFYYRRQRDCLPKALTTFHLLRRQGIPAELCFGVKKFPFTAHTWVEVFGERLDDDPPRLQLYTVIHRVAG
jgi:hypothetical protein